MATTFVQLHFLTPYAPSNLNRDDLGRPKTALFGGTQRLRVSSQSLKRAWRTSDAMETTLAGHLGVRTRDLGRYVERRLLELGASPNLASKHGERFSVLFAAPKAKKKVAEGESREDAEATAGSEQVAFVSASEFQGLSGLLERIAKGGRVDDEELKALIDRPVTTSDIALFGRMLTDLNKDKAKKLPEHQRGVGNVARAQFSVEAACQVAHAISVHKVAIEDDYFTAVDDLQTGDDPEGAGAAHVGTQEFASAVLYHYVCIDRALLLENLGGDEPLAARTLRALAQACLTVAPGGKQASFGSRSRAHFALAEKGPFQPRSLASAFLKPVAGDDLLAAGIEALRATRTKLDTIYGEEARSVAFDALAGSGSLKDLLDFVEKP